MRLGLLIYGGLDTLSGGYLYDRRLVEHLLARGDEVEIISLPWRNYPAHLGDNLDRALQRRLESLQVDALIQDELNHPSLAWLNYRLKGKVRYPILAIVHHLRSSERHPAWVMGFYRAVERRYLNSLDGFIYNSRVTRQEVERLTGRACPGVIATPGGDRLGAVVSAEEIRARALRPGPLTVLFAGNIIPRKGLDLLIGALAGLNRADWRLVVVGPRDADPAYNRKIEGQVARLSLGGRISFLGKVGEDRLREEMRGAHLLAVPSQYEGFGIVYLEGMAFGLPAIGSRAGGAAEIIQDGESGWLVPPGDGEALAERLRWLMDDRARLAEMSLAARRRFQDFPGWADSMELIRERLVQFARVKPGAAAASSGSQERRKPRIQGT